MAHRKTAPPLDLNFSTLNGKVNGHKSRCQALDELWRMKYYIDYDLEEIHVIDMPVEKNNGYYSKAKVSFDGKFIVEITDMDILSNEYANVVINYNIGANNKIAYQNSNIYARFLLGERYFIADWRIQSLAQYKGCSVVVAPGGNKNDFFGKIDINYVAGLFEKIVIAIGLDKYEFLTEVANANVVITTPSTSAMEALALGTPVLLIRTSWDQTGEFVKNGYAEWFSEEKVSKYTQGKTKAKRRIPTDNVVVDEIYNEWTKWRSE